MEFMAEQEIISIIPYFRIAENDHMLNLIEGDFGPFQPGISVQVPLWLAITLKQLNKCRIIQPSWLTVENLREKLEREKQSDLFEALPFHYMEISSLLLDNAVDDVDYAESIRSLLEDIQNIRQDKIRNGLRRISSDVQAGGTAYAVQMNNIAGLEVNSVRRFMIQSLNKFYKLTNQNDEKQGNDLFESQSQSQAYSTDNSTPGAAIPRLRRFR